MPKLLSGQVLRTGGSGQFIALPGAQPALGPTPNTSTGYTLITTPTGITSYSNSLGNVSFFEGSLTNYIPGQNITINVSTSGALVVNAPTIFNNSVLFASTLTFTDLLATGHIRFTGNFGSNAYTTGTLIVTGGVGISENLYVGNEIHAPRIYDNEVRVISRVQAGVGLSGGGIGPSVTLTNTGVLSLTAGTGTFVSTSTGDVVVWTYGNTLQDVLTQGNSATIKAYFYNQTNATSVNTAAIVISGGLGVGKDVVVGGTITADNLISNTVVSTNAVFTTTVINGQLSSTSTIRDNALYVAGGVGVQTDLTVGNNAFIYGNLTVLGTATQVIYNVADVGRKVIALSTSAGPAILSIDSGITVGPIANPFVKFLFDGVSSWKSQGNIIPSTGNTYNVGSVSYQWANVYSQKATLGNTQATSTLSGALQIAGGAGIVGNLYVGGISRIVNSTSATSTLTGALQIQGGLGVQGSIYASNYYDAQGLQLVSTGTINQYGIVAVVGRTDTVVSTSGGIVSIWNSSNLQTVTDRGAITNRAVTFASESESVSTQTGAVIIAGGLGVGKDLYARNIYSNSAQVVTTGTIFGLAVTSLTAGTDTAVSTSTGNVVIWDTSNLQSVTGRGNSTTNAVYIYNTLTVNTLTVLTSIVANKINVQTTASITRDITAGGIALLGTDTRYRGSSSYLGIGNQTMRVSFGGIGIIGDSYFSDTVGIGGLLYVSGKMYSGNAEVLTTASVGTLLVEEIYAGTDTAVSTTTGVVTIWNTSTLQSITNRGSTTTQAITISSLRASSNTTTGALVVAGGVGIGGRLNVALTSYIAGAQIITTATINQYATATKLTAGTDTAISTSTGNITIWNTSTLQSITNRGSTTSNIITITNTTPSVSTQTGALVVAGGVGIGGSINVVSTSYINGSQILTTATVNDYASKTIITAGTDTAVSTSTGNVTIWNTSTLQSITNRGTTTTNKIRIANTSQSLFSVTGNALEIPTGGLGVGGSARIGGSALIVGSTTIQNTINSINTNSSQSLLVAGGLGVGGNIVSGKIISVDGTKSTVAGAGSLQIAGGGYFAKNIVVMDSSASTGSITSNALYVDGGVGISKSLFVNGDSIFSGSVTFNGTATYVYSTNTYYTDNIIELHVPEGGASTPWTIDDGQDIGLRFHYYKGTDLNAGLVLSSTSGLLEWYSNGFEDPTIEEFTEVTYGGFKTGNIVLTSSTYASNTLSGALLVQGGIGVNGNIYVEGAESVASSTETSSQSIVVNNGIGVIGDSYFANNVGIAGTLLLGNTSTAYLKPVSDDYGIYFREDNVTATNYYQYGGLLADTLGHNFYTGGVKQDQQIRLSIADDGVNITGDLYVQGALHATISGASSSTSNLLGGDTGSIPYQIAPNTTEFIGIGPSGSILQSNGSTASWVVVDNLNSSTSSRATSLLTVNTASNETFYSAFVSTSSEYGPIYTDTDLTYNPGPNIFTFGGRVSVGQTLTNYGVMIAAANVQSYTTTDSGALQVQGGASISGNLYAGALFEGNNRVISSINPIAGSGINITVQNSQGPRATFTVINTGVTSIRVGTDTAISGFTGDVTIWNTGTLQSITNRGSITNNYISITNLGESNNTTTGALLVAGGVGIGKSLTVGRTVTAGIAKTDTPVDGFISNNTLLSSYTSQSISSTSTQNLDSWDINNYRSAKYMIQLIDSGYSPARVHATELLMIHDGTDVYISEYGIVTNLGELGTFDATISGSNVQLSFTPSFPSLIPSLLTVKSHRTTITI
jgi:hypothetical protein